MTKRAIVSVLALSVVSCAQVPEPWQSGIQEGTYEIDNDKDEPQSKFVCEAIDILFVVDNSPSMADEQQNLVAAVPYFVAAMQDTFPQIDSIHVGVVDTDAYPAPGTDPDDPLASCPEDVDCGACDFTLGALVSRPFSGSVSDETCGFSSGRRYMDAESPEFETEFACAVTVGTQGNPAEQQVGALIAALDPKLSAAGACNEGFLRDDARLVTVLVTDEEDDHNQVGGSLGEPAQWYEAVTAAKDGDADEVVVLGLLGGAPKFDDCAELSEGNDGAELTPRLVKFIGEFEHGFVGSVCGSSYVEFFRRALSTVARSCTVFVED